MEPGAPSPKARMEAVGYLAENGISSGIMVAPLLPGISDDPRNIDDVIKMAAKYGARHLSGNVLFLKP